MGQADLLEQAIRKAGSQAAIGRLIDQRPPRVSAYRHGTEPIPDYVVAQLAAYLGIDPIRALADTKGGPWKRVAQAMKDKISAPFEWLLSHANPRGALFSAG